jgi:DNA polymerase II large subunit
MSNRWKSDSFLADVQFSGDKFTFKHAQDIDPYLKSAHEQRKVQQNVHNMRKIASIPDLMYEKLIKEDPELVENPNKLIPKLKELKEKGLDFTTVERI